MSRSRSTNQTEGTTAMLNQPRLTSMSVDSIIANAKMKRPSSLSTLHEKQIHYSLKNDSSLISLSKLLDEFISMYQHYSGLAGLTPKETEQLRELLNVRNAFKQTHKKGEYDGPGFRQFILNERKIVSFNKSMQWWQTNIEMLRKLSLWESLNTIIVNTARNEALPQSELSDQQHKLTDIKHEWSRQQLFANYSSENLLEFYNNYLIVIEDTMNNILKNVERYPDEITAFILDELYNIKEMRKQAIYSMVARLNVMEENNDLESDDILHQVIKHINTECGITLDQSGIKPAPRTGLTADTINNFIAAINSYVKANPGERIVLSTLENHSALKTPFRWARFSDAEIANSLLNKSPSITFVSNKAPDMISGIDIKSLYKYILSEESENGEKDILGKIKRMLGLANDELKKISSSPKNELDRKIMMDIENNKRNFDDILKNIYLRISIEIRNTIQKSINNLFSAEPLDYENITQLSKYLSRAEEYDRAFISPSYDPDKDIILAISVKIKSMVEQGENISNDMIDKISKLLMLASDSAIQTSELENHLTQLPELIRGIHANDDPYIMHFIAHQIESNLLMENNIESALKRHAYIAELYDEPWSRATDTQEINVKDTRRTARALQSYIHTVLIPLTHNSPTINLDNFDISHVAKNIRDLCASIHNNEDCSGMMDKYKLEYETEIMLIVNKLFNIKKYIYQSGTENINTSKLLALKNRLTVFFSNKQQKEKLLSNLKNACADLTKDYLVNMIQTNREPDSEYIANIQSSLGADILSTLVLDKDIARLLVNYIQLYGGTTNAMGHLLVEASKHNPYISNEDMIYTYASKRLAYIAASNTVTKQDYNFFQYFDLYQSISKLFESYRKKTAINFPLWLTENSIWDEQRAMLIELFGTKNEVDSYRFKRIRELLSSSSHKNSDGEKQKTILNDFFETVDTSKLYNNKLVNPKNIIVNKTTIHDYLDYAADSKPWSFTLESIIEKCGTDNQLQTLHYRFLSKQLGSCSDIRDTLLGRKLTSLTTRSDYLTFMDDDHVKKLVAQIERMLTNVQAANIYTSKNELSRNDHHLYISMITALKPLKEFYNNFSSQNAYKDMYRDLPDLENKIELHQTLHETIKKQTNLLSIANDNTTLHNHILTLTKNVIDLEDGRYLTSDNTAQYIKFATTEILDQVTSVTESMKLKPSLPVLLTLTNLLAQLPSNGLKLQLSIAHKQEALDHPVWLTLINHLDEHQGLLTVINYLSHMPMDANLGSGFSDLLAFSRKLNAANHQVHQLIKGALLKEAGIKMSKKDNIDFDNLAKPGNLSDKQLMSLWSATITNINTDSTSSFLATASTKYMIKLATRLGEELLLRARNNSYLLSKFTDTFLSLSAIYQQPHVNDSKIETSKPDHLSLWASSRQPTSSLSPLISLANRAVTTMSLQQLESFIVKKISPQQLEAYRKLSNDPTYLDTNKAPEKVSTLVRDMLDIKSDNIALAVTYTLPIYHYAQKSLLNNQSAHNLHSIVGALSSTVATNSNLASAKDFKPLIDTLVKLSDFNPMIQNDRVFANTSTWKRLFSLSG